MTGSTKFVENWGIARASGVTYLSATSAIGKCVVYGYGAHSTPIVEIDAVNRTVRTKSGSTYALGVPNLMFAATHPETMRELGF